MQTPAARNDRELAHCLLDAPSVETSSFEPHVVRALELQVGKARVVIDLAQVDRIIEATCTPLPMAHPLVRGIGFDGGRPMICVVLSGKSDELAAAPVTAVLLTGATTVAWALCADKVLGTVPLIGRSTTIEPRWPRWLRRVRSEDGRTLAQFDGAQMILDIGGVP